MADGAAAPSLVGWGVSAQADLVYRALVSFGPWSITEISGSLEMPPRLVRLVLDELNDLGAAAPAAGGNGDHPEERLWRSRSPHQVITLLRRRQRQAEQDRRRLYARLARLGHPTALGDPDALAGARLLSSGDCARRRFAELIIAERHEHLAMNPEPAFSMAEVKAAAPLSRALLAQGVTIRSLGVPAAVEDESGWHDDELRANGMEYKELPEVSTKLMVLDRTTALVPVDPGKPHRGYWEISEPATVTLLVGYFFERWDRAADPGRSWLPPTTLSPRERAIAALLAAGHTDAGIAEKLDLSLRTIAYAVGALMERYQVTTRFQLGLRLGVQAEAERRTHDTAGGE